MSASKPEQAVFPVISLLFTATMWGLVWYPLRLLEDQGLSGLWITQISYSAALLSGIWLLLIRRAEPGHHPLLLMGLGLSAGWCNVSFILAVLDGTVVRVLLLFYLSPLWAIVLGWLVLGERPDRSSMLVFWVALSGAIIMLWDNEIGVPWPSETTDWLAVSSGFSFAISNVFVRKLQQVSVVTKSASTWIGVVAVASVWLLANHAPLPDIDQTVLLGVVALGMPGFVVMTLALQYGVSHMPVHRSAVILLFELVIGAVSSLLLTDEVIHIREWTGGALIIAAAYFAAKLHVGEGKAANAG